MNQLLYQGFIATQPLWNNTQFGLKQFDFPAIASLENIKQTIPAKLRLGHQMEYVFLQLIQEHDRYDVLVHNKQIKRGNQSIGEIDFILEDIASKQKIHIELTYKFYLIDPDISEPIHRLMGPNRNDMFFRKMEKIKERQFPLLQSPEVIQVLEPLNIDVTKIEQQTCFKAQLFMPYEEPNVTIRPLNTSCVSGFWLRFDVIKSSAFTSFKFYIPRKVQWVIAPKKNVRWLSHFEMLMDVNLRLLKKNSPMVWMQKPDGTIDKVFIVWW